MRRSEHKKTFLDKLASLFRLIRKPSARAEMEQPAAVMTHVEDELKDFSRGGLADGMQVVEIEQTEFVLEWERVVASVESAKGMAAATEKVDRRLPQYDRRFGQEDRRMGERRNGNGAAPAQAPARQAQN